MRFQAGIQILLLVIAVVIMFMVIKPKFADIQYSQNEIIGYQKALTNAGQYNQKLQELMNRANNMSRANRIALDRFLPGTINPTVVSRDIQNIVEQNGLVLMEVEAGAATTITSSNPGESTASEGGFVESDGLLSEAQAGLTAQRFTVEVLGGYEQMKKMLQDLERNAYPLRVVSLSFQARADSIFYRYSIELESYALKQ